MPSPAALKFIAAGFLMSVLVWSLLPEASHTLKNSDWAQVPDSFSSDAASTILQARNAIPEPAFMPAAGQANSKITGETRSAPKAEQTVE